VILCKSRNKVKLKQLLTCMAHYGFLSLT